MCPESLLSYLKANATAYKHHECHIRYILLSSSECKHILVMIVGVCIKIDNMSPLPPRACAVVIRRWSGSI